MLCYGLAALFPRTPATSALGLDLGLWPFGPRLSLPPNFQTPTLRAEMLATALALSRSCVTSLSSFGSSRAAAMLGDDDDVDVDDGSN